MIETEFDEQAEKRLRDEFAKVPYAGFLGMEIISLTYGAAVLKLEMRDRLRQTHGVLHGGATASLIDTAMAFAIMSVLEKDERATTIDLTVHYLRPVSEGEILCAAKVLRAGRRILTVSAECAGADGKTAATALSSCAKY